MAGVNNRSGVLANIDEESIIERIAQGERAYLIAAELGVAHSSLYRRMAKNPDYLPARSAAYDFRLDKATDEIASAADQCSVSRGRELFRAIAWRAEREFPQRWGQKQEVTQVSINVLADPSTLGKLSDLIARARALECHASTLISDNTQDIPSTPVIEGPVPSGE